MIRVIQWGARQYQIIIEDTSFYFYKLLPIAFRMPKSKTIMCRSDLYYDEVDSLFEQLKHTGALEYINRSLFERYMTKAYHKAILMGARRIGIEALRVSQVDDEDFDIRDKIWNQGKIKMSLTKNTMIAYLKIEMLGMASKDRMITDNINKKHLKTSDAAGHYQKCKIDRASVSRIISTTQWARAVHKMLTRPFGDDGWRLLPATRIKEYTKKMHTAKVDFEAAVHDVEARWPAIIKKQYDRLKSPTIKAMFDADDYPFVKKSANPPYYIVLPNANLMKCYTFDFELRPTPDQGHVVVDIERQTILEIKENLKQREKDNLEKSKLELWKRLIEPVKNMADICGNDKKVFKSLVENIEKEIDILKDLNVTNDIDMTNMLGDVTKSLTGYTPGQIRDDKRLKKDLGQKAENLTNIMDSYMQGPQK